MPRSSGLTLNLVRQDVTSPGRGLCSQVQYSHVPPRRGGLIPMIMSSRFSSLTDGIRVVTRSGGAAVACTGVAMSVTDTGRYRRGQGCVTWCGVGSSAGAAPLR